jgi:hypothetical protein
LDIHAVYKARPELVWLQLNLAAVNATCTATDIIPGLKLWNETRTSFRAAAVPTRIIDV